LHDDKYHSSLQATFRIGDVAEFEKRQPMTNAE
jgi:hypothetical protein